ncbi:MAG TPA: LysR family transcriptional regulator, partial [Clostridia bacterium]|nr:LysR family transcriptional regulator [Clostridia bacterium]
FLTLCRVMNYTRTAQMLNVTQPTVTQHIRYLEGQYGCSLFSYVGKTLSLTPQGKRLRDFALSMAYNSQRIQECMRQSGELLPAMRLGATKTIGEFVIGPMISAYLRENPACRLSLLVDNTHTLLGLLERGELDFAVLEGFFDKSKYGYQLYKNESFLGVCAVNHSLADRTLTIDDIMSQNIIIREPGSGTRAIFEQLLMQHNYSFESISQTTVVSDFSVIKQLVCDGIGIAFLYEPVVRAELQNGRLKKLHLTDMEAQREFNYVFLKQSLFLEDWQRFFASQID